MATLRFNEGDRLFFEVTQLIDEQKTPFNIKCVDGKLYITFGSGGTAWGWYALPLDRVYELYCQAKKDFADNPEKHKQKDDKIM